MGALFFEDSTMHKIYEDKGKYNFLYQIPNIIIPILISNIIIGILKYFSIYEDKINKIINNNENNNEDKKVEINNLLQSLKVKFIIFFIFLILFLLFFWYYLSSFCAVFKNTQIQLIKDTIIGYAKSLSLPFIYTFITCSLRCCALKKKRCCLYKASDIIGELCDFFL